MRKLTLVILALASLLFVNTVHAAVPTMEEEDGSPSTTPWKSLWPNGSLTDNGDSTTSIDFADGIGGAFTAGSIVFSDGTTLTEDNANLFWDDGNNEMGIGTNTPDGILHLDNGASDTDLILEKDAGTSSDIIFHNTGTAAAHIAFDSSEDILFENDTSDRDIVWKINDGGVDTEFMRIDGDVSFLGIGTATPGFKVDITDSTRSTFRIASTDSTASQGPFFTVRRASSSPAANDSIGAMLFSGTDSEGGDNTYARFNALIIDPTNGSESGAFTFSTDNAVGGPAEAMRIDGNQEIGIGDTSPEALLDLSGAVATHALFQVQSTDDSTDNAMAEYLDSTGLQLSHINRFGQYIYNCRSITPSNNRGAFEACNDSAIFMRGHVVSTTAGDAFTFLSRRSRGTEATPTIGVDGDTVFQLQGTSHDGANFEANAVVKMTLEGTMANNQMPTNIILITSETSSAGRTDRLKISPAGDIAIGEQTAAEHLEVEDADAETAIQISNTATSGDPILTFALSGTRLITMGVDDSAGDKFKIGTTALNTNTSLTITTGQLVGIGAESPASLFEVDGPQGLALLTVTGNTTLDNTHSTVLVNASGNVTITLPTAASSFNSSESIGRIYEIKKIDADADTVTIDPDSSEQIEFSTTLVMTVQGEAVTITTNGSAWFVL